MRRLLACLAVLLCTAPARAELPAFDYYLLSLSLEPSFCAGSRNAGRGECRRLTPESFRQTPLTLHGLWPNRARVSTNRQPQDCDGPRFAVSRSTAAALRAVMPGGLGLARYEWRKHGTCSGLDPDRYFATAASLTRQANDAIGPALLAMNGVVHLDDLQQRLAATDPALAAALVVDCRFAPGGVALLEEIRLTLGRDGRPIPAASVGLGQNSGCPGGIGRIPLPPP